MAGISNLLVAAEILDRFGSEDSLSSNQQSGDASADTGLSKLRSNASSTNGQRSVDRATHNQLEKNRRAHLRTCLDYVKELVPLGSDASRHTTLTLLTRSRFYIKKLEESEKSFVIEKGRLLERQAKLKRHLALLSGNNSSEVAISNRLPVNHCVASDNNKIGQHVKQRHASESSTSTISAPESDFTAADHANNRDVKVFYPVTYQQFPSCGNINRASFSQFVHRKQSLQEFDGFHFQNGEALRKLSEASTSSQFGDLNSCTNPGPGEELLSSKVQLLAVDKKS